MFNLMQRAVSSCRQTYTVLLQGGDITCTWFYRNKSAQYFSNVTSKHGGVMKTYIKDASGDPRSPINGEIKGLFFMSKVEDGHPQARSPFGNTRLLVRANILLGLAPNVYFADFYCLNGKDHYITLVLARHGSDADRLCHERLPILNIYSKNASPFLYIEKGEVRVSSTFMVELFFTEDLEVAQLLADGDKAQMKYNIRTICSGQTSQGGRAKRSSCRTCGTRENATSNVWASLGEF